MRYMRWVLLGFALGMVHTATAEPWLSNKFAGNCAGCHAPGRKNLEPVGRRCSLSCQGCHVNPNGGGLRSFYGKWNENRWLRSFDAKPYLQRKEQPLPLKDQKYTTVKKSKLIKKLYMKYGAPLKTMPEDATDLSLYDKYNDLNHKKLVKEEDIKDWLFTIPDDDPYHKKDRTKIDGGGDFRYQYAYLTITNTDENGVETDTNFHENWLMAADLSIRYRPINRHVHLVWESRFTGFPTAEVNTWMSSFARRSMYVMVDDLPYNTFGMLGVYRPLIGLANADHTLLGEVIKSQALQDNPNMYSLAYEGLTVGGSPNVPFANFHILGRQYNSGSVSTTNTDHFGFAANLGGRFVTLGLSPTYTFFFSKRNNASGTEVKTLLHDLTLGASYDRYTVNLDLLFYSKGVDNQTFISGTYLGLESYIQVWRDIYGTLTAGYSTTSSDLKPGSALQLRAGARGFLIPGVDVSFAITYGSNETVKETENTTDGSTDEVGFLAQLHLFM